MPPLNTIGRNEADGPLTAPSYQPTTEEQEIIRLVLDRFKEAEEARRPMDETWLQNVAFTLGKQWHRYNWQSGQLELPRAPAWKVRASHNLVRSKVSQASSVLVSDIPQLDVEPMSTQPQDIASARDGGALLKYLHERLRWERLYISLSRWLAMTGTAWIKTFWDPTQMDTHAVPVMDQMGNPQQGPDGQPIIKGDVRLIGQIGTVMVSPFEMYPQPGVHGWDEVEWTLHCKVRTLEYVRDRYPEKGRYVRSDDQNTNGGYIERRVADLMETGGNAPVQRRTQQCVVNELWVKPCGKYPRGLLATVANNVLLRSGPLPYQHLIQRRALPFTHFVYEPFELRIWGQSLVEDLVGPQKEYNRVLSDLIGILKTTGMPKILEPVDCRLTSTGPTNQPGERIKYWVGPNGAKPEYWQPAAIPAVWMEILDRIRNDMEDITQRHQVSAGSTPPGVDAGVAIQLLQESDNKAFGPIVTLFQEALGEHGMQALSLAKQFYSEQRMGFITGEDDRREVKVFSQANLPDYADVRCVEGAKTPMSRAAKQQQLFSLYDRGVFGPPGSPGANLTILKRLEFGDTSRMVEEQQAELKRQADQAMQQQAQQQQMMGEQQMAQQQAQGQQGMMMQHLRGQQQAAQSAQQHDQGLEAASHGADQQAALEIVKQAIAPPPPNQNPNRNPKTQKGK